MTSLSLLILTAILFFDGVGVLLAQRTGSKITSAFSGVAVPEMDMKTIENMGSRQPGHFTENRGQWNHNVRFLMKNRGLNMWISDYGVVYDFYESHEVSSINALYPLSGQKLNTRYPFDPYIMSFPEHHRMRGHVVHLNFLDASQSSHAKGVHDLGTRTNYFLGSEVSMWGADCRSYENVQLQNLYDGIDVLFYQDQGLPRYDIVVSPGADPSLIRFRLEGAEGVEVMPSGSLAIKTSLGRVEMCSLFTYQKFSSSRIQEIESSFCIDESGVISFTIENYDSSRELIIDPLLYSTFIGGDGNERAEAFAIDADGRLWVAGSTTGGSVVYPTTLGAYDTVHNGNLDVFVAQIDPMATGSSQLLYSTFIGSISIDAAYGLAVDKSGSVWITGATRRWATSFYPTTSGAYDVTHNGNTDVFVTQLNPADTGIAQLAYSTFLGSTGDDIAEALVVNNGKAYITGRIYEYEGGSTPYPTTYRAYDRNHNGSYDIFVTQLDPAQKGSAQLAYSTLLGGDGSDVVHALALDKHGKIWIAGGTHSTIHSTVLYPTTANGYSRTNNGASDVFVTQLDPTQQGSAQLVYSTLIGGSHNDIAKAMVLDTEGMIWIAGSTHYDSYPTTSNAYKLTDNGQDNIFVTKLSPSVEDTTQLVYSTVIGAISKQEVNALALDEDGNVWITGYTRSSSRDYPTTSDAYDTTLNGGDDVFVTLLNPTVTGSRQLVYSTFIGGGQDDVASALAIDEDGNAWIVGYANGNNPNYPYPTTSNAYDRVPNGRDDAFITQLKIHQKPSGVEQVYGSEVEINTLDLW